jgi:superfamily II DNA or RNA helicase
MCLRKVANWSYIQKEHKFEKNTFDPEAVVKSLDIYSPKIATLLKNIQELDEQDLKKHGKLFKHFIFSEVKSGGYGVKMIASAMIGAGFQLAYDQKIRMLDGSKLKANKGKNFSMLSSTTVFDIPITVKAKKDILNTYNQRPDNVNGDIVRFILLDAGFKEGIDLFDVKYVHIFEPQTSKADQKQAIGRATRLCGQKGLEFHPKYGWPLSVFLYDVSIPKDLVEEYNAETLFRMYLNHSGVDLRKVEFAEELEKYAIVSAVDYELTKNVHRFKVDDDDIDLEWMFPSKGGAKIRSTDVACDKPCSLSRPNKNVPISMPLFIAIAFASEMDLPDLRKKNPREYFCDMLKKNPEFCALAKQAWKDPVNFVKSHEKQIMDALFQKRHLRVPLRTRSPFYKFIYTILDRPKAIKKLINNPEAASLLPTPKTQNENIPLPSSFKEKEPESVGSSPQKIMNFLEMRQHVRENFQQYTWPKVKLENLCVPKGGVSEIVKFTPTQDFMRNFFTPSSAYKGMLLWHSVGTGKCWKRDTPILMFDGSIKKVQDVQVGDIVMGDDSTPRQVLSLGRGVDDMFDVVPEHGETYTVNSEHILVLKDSRDNIVEIEVKDYIKLPKNIRQMYKGIRTSVEFPPCHFPIDPYFAGAMFAKDGERLAKCYKCNSRDVRLQVLAGIVDSCGDYDVKSHSFIIPHVNDESWINDLLYLVRSLGFAVMVKEKNIFVWGNNLIDVPVCGFEINALTKHIEDPLYVSLEVKHVGKDDYFGFTLDCNNRLLMGDFTVTHNTCCAIATASSSFEKEGYTILWVTRSTLKSDIWKNMFDQVCSLVMQQKMVEFGGNLPEQNRMNLLSSSWKIRPMSYKQFSNLVSQKNALYEQLVKINGKQDPLKKTLLIIDEAHKLYGGEDLLANERPDMKKLQEAIMKSYKVSGKDSVRLMMMTATPITNDPMELIKLINLCRMDTNQLSDSYEDFAEEFMLDESGHFTKKGSRKFLDSVAGYISYLSREKDARQFSQPIITSVNVPLSRSSIDYKKAADIEAQFVDKISEVSSEISEINQWMNEKKKEIAARKRDVKNECKGLKKEKRAECLEKIKKQIDELNDELFKQKMIADDGKEDVKAKLKELRKQKKTLMDREMTDYSQEGILRNKCIKKNKDDDDDERNSRRGDKENSRD